MNCSILVAAFAARVPSVSTVSTVSAQKKGKPAKLATSRDADRKASRMQQLMNEMQQQLG